MGNPVKRVLFVNSEIMPFVPETPISKVGRYLPQGIQEQKKEISILAGKESFGQFRLDYYPDRIDPMYGASPRAIMERNFQTCRKYALYFTPNAGNLLFVGGKGQPEIADLAGIGVDKP